MKKFTAVFMAALLAVTSSLALSGCGKTPSDGSDGTQSGGNLPDDRPGEAYAALKTETEAKVTYTVNEKYSVGDIAAIEYTGAAYKGEQTKVFAYLGFPDGAEKPEKVPAVVLVHGGGGTAFHEWVRKWNDRGYAAIAMDTEGKRPDWSRNGLGGPGTDYMRDDASPLSDQWIYQASAAVIRATTLLAADERVDEGKIGVVGVSWGSVITSVVLGADERPSFGAPIYGSGYLYDSSGMFSDYGISEKTWSLWDPSLAFGKYRAKVRYFNSDHDPYFSSDITSRSAEETGSQITYLSEHVHGHDTAWAIREVYAFADEVTGSTPLLPEITSVKRDGNVLRLTFSLPEEGMENSYAELYVKNSPLTYVNVSSDEKILESDYFLSDAPVRFDYVNGKAEIILPPFAQLAYVNVCVRTDEGTLRTSSRLIPLTEGAIPSKTQVKELMPAEKTEWTDASDWCDELLDAYVKPYWYTREIYNETVMFVGEEGSATLLFTPSEVRKVCNYGLTETYREGVDYEIKGNVIRRLKGSRMPYWEIDEYFLKQPNDPNIIVEADMGKTDVPFGEQRYLPYGEYDTFTSRQVAVSYRHDDVFRGEIPSFQGDNLQNFVSKVRRGEKINMIVYGDSVATGCNASGTSFGGNVSPHMPDAYHIVKRYTERKYGCEISIDNQAVGGWRISQCLNAYHEKISGKSVDVMILRIGGNDTATTESDYRYYLNSIIDAFFKDYPSANLIIQTPERPNGQAAAYWTGNIRYIPYWTKTTVKNHPKADRIAVADVQALTDAFDKTGKKTRDTIANNVNHSNDFIIRLYAQVILKTVFGSEYVSETYKK